MSTFRSLRVEPKLLTLVPSRPRTADAFIGIKQGFGMESVEEMMKQMNLTTAKARSIKVAAVGSSREGGKPMQAVGKVFSEKPVNAEGLVQSLGRI